MARTTLLTLLTLLTMCAAALIAGSHPVNAADLQANTAAAFDRYVRLTERRLDEELAGSVPFLWIDRLPELERREVDAELRRGGIVVSRLTTREDRQDIEIPDGLCHHWVGTIFVPGARLDRTAAFMQAYDQYQIVYRPAVRRSSAVSREGERFHVSLQLFMKKIVSVVLNTEYDVRYVRVAPGRMQVRSTSTRIAEVWEPDTPAAHEAPVGHDDGFLWRFNNYCALEERGQGTYVQCETVSLSRSVPTGLGWLIGPFVSSVPRESLAFTLGTMRRALEI